MLLLLVILFVAARLGRLCVLNHLLLIFCTPHSFSNGSGKTALVMSILWAFTGSIDPRPFQDGRVSDIVNDQCKVSGVLFVERALVENKPHNPIMHSFLAFPRAPK
jgi:hypothetical protein